MPVALPPLKERAMQKRRRLPKQPISLKDRLAAFAEETRKKAASAVGREREELLKKASLADTAAHVDDWINSSGLQPPK